MVESPSEAAADRKVRRWAAWMLAALAAAAAATLAVVGWYPYPDLQAGYALIGGMLMAALAIGGFLLWRRENGREAARLSLYQTIIVVSAFFLVLVAPTCIGTLLSSAP